MIYCDEHGWNPVPDDQLPVELPEDVEWKPTGESPLKLHPTWKERLCPVCGEPATRETDTMDTFMCSSWYHLRYLSPHYHEGPFDEAEYNYWMPVDIYTGGIEHATMHLIYTRFFHKALRDMGITEGPEPMLQLRNQGMVLGEDHEKMSKSRGNVIAPDELVQHVRRRHGARLPDVLCTMGHGRPVELARYRGLCPLDAPCLDVVHRYRKTPGTASEEVKRTLRRKVHQTLQSVTDDFETVRIQYDHLLVDGVDERDVQGPRGRRRRFERMGRGQGYLPAHAGPGRAAHRRRTVDRTPGQALFHPPAALAGVGRRSRQRRQINIPVQVNGKLRDRVVVPADASEEDIKSAALATEGAQKYMDGKQPRKVIVVPKKLVNIVV